jgi:hypothetical protein
VLWFVNVAGTSPILLLTLVGCSQEAYLLYDCKCVLAFMLCVCAGPARVLCVCWQRQGPHSANDKY